jgi:hypothetical protein
MTSMTVARERRGAAAASTAGLAIAVMVGWFAVAVIAVICWVAAHSADATVGPYAVPSRIAALVVALFMGLPIGVVSITAGAILLTLARRRLRSGWLIGTVAGLGGLLTGVVVVVGALLVWSWIAATAGW